MEEILFRLTDLPEITHAHSFATGRYDLHFPKGIRSLEVTYIEEGDVEKTEGSRKVKIPAQTFMINDFSGDFSMKSAGRHAHSTVGIRMREGGEERGLLVLPAQFRPSEAELKLFYRILAKRAENPADIGASVLALQLLYEISERYQREKDEGTLARDCRYVRKAREYIVSHLYGAVRIPEIAAALSISEGHLSRVFRAAMHVSIIDYVNRMKVNVMAEIMQTQRITLAKAAETMGIGDPCYASRLFARYMGIPASRYRKQNDRIVR